MGGESLGSCVLFDAECTAVCPNPTNAANHFTNVVFNKASEAASAAKTNADVSDNAGGGGTKAAMLMLAVILGCGLGWYCYKQRAPGSGTSMGVPAAKYGRNYKAVD